MPIHVLDNETIDKIAAGEVVERPSSVVKELVENSIDAGATAVTVEVKEGGTELIRVTDNGCGIPAGELRNAFLRHATSKIENADDLSHIRSLGFRGEALSSICAVSRLEIITKTADSLAGTRMTMEGASETVFEEVGAPQGTTILVRNLFFNTPARRKFLKTPMTEGSYISDLMERMALSHPEVSFQVTMNGKTRFHTSGNGDLKEVIYRVYGKEVSSSLLPIDTEENGIRIRGFLGKPELVRSNRNLEVYFINGRYIRSDLIAKAIEEGYREYLMLHKFPMCFLVFTVDPTRVDVNVHPTKMDVRISDQNLFFRVVSEAVEARLRAVEMIPGNVLRTGRERKQEEREARKEIQSGKNPEPFEMSRRTAAPDQRTPVAPAPITPAPVSAPTAVHKPTAPQGAMWSMDFSEDTKLETEAASSKPGDNEPKKIYEAPRSPFAVAEDKVMQPVQTAVQASLFDDGEKILSAEKRPDFRIVGQVFDTFWIVQHEKKMLIIDQHAAHEKVNYERMMKRVREKTVLSQSLLPPVVISLTGKEENVLNEHLEAFRNLGFEIEHFGGTEYALRAVPVDLYGKSERELFLEVLEELASGNVRGSYQAIEEKVASMACKASVKGGDRLSTAEAEKLIDELLTLDNPYNCPHGRPTIIAMSEYELEKKFKRIVD